MGQIIQRTPRIDFSKETSNLNSQQLTFKQEEEKFQKYILNYPLSLSQNLNTSNNVIFEKNNELNSS